MTECPQDETILTLVEKTDLWDVYTCSLCGHYFVSYSNVVVPVIPSISPMSTEDIIKLRQIWSQFYSEQYVTPIDAPTEITSGAGSYELGSFSTDLISAGVTINDFVLTGIGFTDPSKNGTYTTILYAGIDDTEIGQVSFYRHGTWTSSIFRPMTTEIITKSSRVRAKMKNSAGNATCYTKIYYHYV